MKALIIYHSFDADSRTILLKPDEDADAVLAREYTRYILEELRCGSCLKDSCMLDHNSGYARIEWVDGEKTEFQICDTEENTDTALSLSEIAYALYKLDWCHSRGLDYSSVHSAELRNEKFQGQMYYCYDEFMEYEYRNTWYIDYLFSNVELLSEYSKMKAETDKLKDYLEKDVIEIFTEENGKRYAHFMGYGYTVDGVDENNCRFLEYVHNTIPLELFVNDPENRGSDEYNADLNNDHHCYIEDCNETRLIEIYEKGFGGILPRTTREKAAALPDGFYLLDEGANRHAAGNSKNTLVRYTYRDGNNYKKNNSCIIKGELTQDDIDVILGCLSEGEYFIPRQVGLPEERFEDGLTEDDHCWFELDQDFCSPTLSEPTAAITAKELVKAFCEAKGKWDDYKFTVFVPETESNMADGDEKQNSENEGDVS